MLSDCIQGEGMPHGGYRWEIRAGRSRPEHVWDWEDAYGPVPEGLELDHLCRWKECKNIDHLEPVTSQENTRRGFLDWICPESKREANRRQMIEQRKDPEFVRKIREATNLPHHRSAASNRMKERMADPEYRAKVLAARWPS